jgi:hypothetical protein
MRVGGHEEGEATSPLRGNWKTTTPRVPVLQNLAGSCPPEASTAMSDDSAAPHRERRLTSLARYQEHVPGRLVLSGDEQMDVATTEESPRL